ncbi:7-deoxyloganetin glucosyltransferase-like isoform X2 [Tasmannia lanceolata]|uniref:7-deoxyloganetin glucosyltransferase-like isoform X2 n=1 Tax=Tasmannia lanceolata TaxID=3420 RepID=UPI0040629B0F
MDLEPPVSGKQHAICFPFPAQSYINAMLQLAKLLNSKGFYVTFILTGFFHTRLIRSRGPDSVKGSEEFRFETITDGMNSSEEDTTQDITKLCLSAKKNCLTPFRNIVTKLNQSPNVPQVSCIVSDGIMTFTLQVAEECGIPGLLFWPISTCSVMGYIHFPEMNERGLLPLKDENLLSNETIDWIPGMRGTRLVDFSRLTRTTDPANTILKFITEEIQNSFKASAIVLNTFDDLENEVLSAMKSIYRRVYTIGPLTSHCHQMPESHLKSFTTNLWIEETECLEWLDKQEAASVVYVNFGSVTFMTSQQLNEFAWGLANTKHPFLWIIRRDILTNGQASLPEDFMTEIEGRGLLASWCPQEEVLSHPSIAWFLTHCGWNSTLESICGGVPMICWPQFGDQPINCRYTCNEWGIGIEISNDVKREEIEHVIRGVMEGEKGEVMRLKAMKWKVSAENATGQGGSSSTNLDRLISEVPQLTYD